MAVVLNYTLTSGEEVILGEARTVLQALSATNEPNQDDEAAIYLFRAGLARLSELALQGFTPRIGIVNAIVPLMLAQGQP